MSPERWQQIKEILFQTENAPVAEREQVLDRLCGEDRELRQEVLELLDTTSEIDGMMEDPLWTFVPEKSFDQEKTGAVIRGRRVGPYRLEKVLGRGGMGVVYLASRIDDYSQRVALKLVNSAVTSNEVLARFLTERQILADLQHPNIARLLDGGTDSDGNPYIVMEYVEGEPIDAYCKRCDLSIRQRLELFAEVCSAVHFAHQNLIVHRDLKAGNILVTEKGSLRLLDFGIAKLLDTGRAGDLGATTPGSSPMTPANASPEQLTGDTITTASDVYSLGVLLYRLLSGQPPYQLEGESYMDIVSAICLQPVEKPSSAVFRAQELEETQVAGNAEQVSLSPAQHRLRLRLSGDLDAIVLKAMRKEPQERYGSVLELAADIKRHLEGLPVMARQGNWVYYSTRFFRRNKLAIAALALILGFAATATWQWREALQGQRQAELERNRAEVERTRATEVQKFLESLFEAANPDQTQGAAVSVLDLIQRGREEIREDAEMEPELKADILSVLGGVFNNLGQFQDSLELKEEALRLRQQADPSPRVELGQELNNLGRLRFDMGDFEAAEVLFRDAVEVHERLGEESEQTAAALGNLASSLSWQGKDDEVEALNLRALEIRQRVLDPDDPRMGWSHYYLGAHYRKRSEFAAAEPQLREALRIWSLAGTESTLLASVHDSLGRVLMVLGNLTEARQHIYKALDMRRRLLKESHPHVAYSRKNVAALMIADGDLEGAGELMEQVLSSLRESVPADGVKMADAERVWGWYLSRSGKFEQAEQVLMKSYQQLLEVSGPVAPETGLALAHLLELYESWGKPAEVQALRSRAGVAP